MPLHQNAYFNVNNAVSMYEYDYVCVSMEWIGTKLLKVRSCHETFHLQMKPYNI